jgi:hypothetical protein
MKKTAIIAAFALGLLQSSPLSAAPITAISAAKSTGALDVDFESKITLSYQYSFDHGPATQGNSWEYTFPEEWAIGESTFFIPVLGIAGDFSSPFGPFFTLQFADVYGHGSFAEYEISFFVRKIADNFGGYQGQILVDYGTTLSASCAKNKHSCSGISSSVSIALKASTGGGFPRFYPAKAFGQEVPGPLPLAGIVLFFKRSRSLRYIMKSRQG